jgi:hypothetical protein
MRRLFLRASIEEACLPGFAGIEVEGMRAAAGQQTQAERIES